MVVVTDTLLSYMKLKYILGLLLLIFSSQVYSQYKVVRGKVIDSSTNDPIPFANVYFKGTLVGAKTDLNGNFKISTKYLGDSLVASYVGYTKDVKPIENKDADDMMISFSLQAEDVNLDEIVFVAPENPAFPIMRSVLQNKNKYNPEALESIETTNYTKIEFDVAELSDKFKEKKIVQKVLSAIDTTNRITNKSGEPLIPIFMSESISKRYVVQDPYNNREEILKANIHGIAISNKKTVAQLTGVNFQQYNFYNNWLNIIDRDFVSPLANGWKLYYNYYLEDSTMHEGDFSYRISFEPKVEGDLAFTGEMWIKKDGYVLKSIEANIDQEANLNFIRSMHIKQKLAPTEEGPWLPIETDFEINVDQLTNNFTGVRARFYISTQDWKLNKGYPPSFFILPVEVSEDVVETPTADWGSLRPEPLRPDEIKAINAISTIDQIPSVRFIAETIKTVRRGYIRTGKVDWGPYIFTYANNEVEGNRLRIGLRTNEFFSEDWVLSGYLAYGFRDKQFKHSADVKRILSRKPWTIIGAYNKYDIQQLGTVEEDPGGNFLVFAASRFGALRSPHMLRETGLYFQTDIRRGLTQRIAFNHHQFDPIFPFAYLSDTDSNNGIKENFSASFVTLETRYAKDEQFIYDNNQRISFGSFSWPIITFKYSRGFEGLFSDDSFKFDKFSLNIQQRLNLGLFGNSFYEVEGGHIPSTLPFPFLKNHIGNETFFFGENAFNLLNFGEFVSDQYAYLKYSHEFNGYVLNRIPVIKRLKLRLVGAFNILYGDLSDENRNLIANTDLDGDEVTPANSIENEPYIEFGYGIDNIFKVIRIMAFHRLTYTNNPLASNFGIKAKISVKP